jgi:hypothetical protein
MADRGHAHADQVVGGRHRQRVSCSVRCALEQRQQVRAGQARRVQLGQRAAPYCRVSTADQSCVRQLYGVTQASIRGHLTDRFPILKDAASSIGSRGSKVRARSGYRGFCRPAHGVARACQIARSPPRRTETRPGLGLRERSPRKSRQSANPQSLPRSNP